MQNKANSKTKYKTHDTALLKQQNSRSGNVADEFMAANKVAEEQNRAELEKGATPMQQSFWKMEAERALALAEANNNDNTNDNNNNKHRNTRFVRACFSCFSCFSFGGGW